MTCVSESLVTSWLGDGEGDALSDGNHTWPEFSVDQGDCDGTSGGGTGSGGIGDSCGEGQVYDCSMTCVSESTAASYTGDGTCDDGTWGYDLTCAEFSFDDGDCDGSSGGGTGGGTGGGVGDSRGDGQVYDCSMTRVDYLHRQRIHRRRNLR